MGFVSCSLTLLYITTITVNELKHESKMDTAQFFMITKYVERRLNYYFQTSIKLDKLNY